ncbi:MAG: class I SAM-dependent methyltransferase [Burkholderiales bacterium]|nr:class I SAM-dependent methyltransferase [Burkholderiales bacterium]
MPDSDAFRNRLARNARHWSRWARRQGIECYRLYDRDVPQFPLAIDHYGAHVHLQEFDTGWQQTDAEHEAWVAGVVTVVGETLGLPAARIHFKRRERQRGASQYQKLRDVADEFEVTEGGLRFLVNLDSYLDTGLFLDHRKTRGMVRDMAAGRKFLNLFAYTGSFTVYAAAGGAVRSESVDLSNTYLDWAGRNLRLNGFDPVRHQLVRADAFAYLDGAARAGKEFDLIVLDPPSFSNSKRMRDVLDVQRDHPRLIAGCMRLLSPRGTLLFSTNRRQFELDPAVSAAWACEDIHLWSVPEDFRSRTVHRCWRLGHNR